MPGNHDYFDGVLAGTIFARGLNLLGNHYFFNRVLAGALVARGSSFVHKGFRWQFGCAGLTYA